MNKKFSTYALAALFSVLPIAASAQFIPPGEVFDSGGGTYLNCPASSGTTLCNIVDQIIGYFNMALILMMSFAVVMFTWYVIKYYIKPNEERKEAGMYVLYSAIGFFVILSIWGIVNILSNTFGGLDNSSNSGALQNNLPLFPTK